MSISVEVFRERLEATHVDLSVVAVRLGWYTTRGHPDTPRVEKALGLRDEVSHGKKIRKRTVTERTALALANAMNLDPVDIGL